jgi:hypothetical protein
MAVLGSGRILRQGAPTQLIAELHGRVWKKVVAKAEIADMRARYQVIATRLSGGRTLVHILSDGDPGDGFEPQPGGLEDVYFSALHSDRHAGAQRAA